MRTLASIQKWPSAYVLSFIAPTVLIIVSIWFAVIINKTKSFSKAYLSDKKNRHLTWLKTQGVIGVIFFVTIMVFGFTTLMKYNFLSATMSLNVLVGVYTIMALSEILYWYKHGRYFKVDA